MALRLISEPEAEKRFDLKRRTSSFDSWQYEQYLQGSHLLLYEGDLDVEGDLHLDWNDWPGELARAHGDSETVLDPDVQTVGLIVDGDLRGGGAVLNQGLEGGALLLVEGNLRARHLVAGGSEIRIFGDAKLDEVLWAHYNDGILAIHGDLEVPLCVNLDHHVEVHGERDVEWDSEDLDTSMSIHDEEGDPILSPQLRELVTQSVTEWGDFEHEVWSGSSVLERFAQSAPPRSLEQWREVVADRPERLRSVPRELIDAELCEFAVQSGPEALEFVPAEFVTREHCLSALERQGSLLNVVPPQLLDRELCLVAADNHCDFEDLPAEYVDEELLERLLLKSGYAVGDIPAHFLNPRLAAASLRGGGGNYLPEVWQTEEVGLRVVGAEPEAIENLPGRMVSTAVLAAAEEQHSVSEEWPDIVDRHRLPDDVDEGNFSDIWAAFLTEGACVDAVADGASLSEVPLTMRTKKVCEAAVKSDAYSFRWVPDELKTPKMCLRAVKDDTAEQLEYVPQELVTDEILLESVLANGNTLRLVSEGDRSVAVCVSALLDDEAAYASVPAKHRAAVLSRMIDHFSEDGAGQWHLLSAQKAPRVE